ncbi:MAG: TonB-dependent receptor [Lentimicrobiaceae bacterium]|nr:TonB-dependent receptor [Lentimicrobiaceae bacterium]
MIKQIILVFCLTIAGTQIAKADGDAGTVKRYTISGNIKDKSTGEELLGATVFVKGLQSGAVTNLYGFYSLSLQPGIYTLMYSYVGYNTIEKEVKLSADVTFNIELETKQEVLQEAVITGVKKNENITKTEMSVMKMDVKTISKIPALMGEVDIIKAIQLLPGVQSTSEGSSGFSVRGGSPDQNLIILDEATVYNASHLMGFFSVFNNDAIKDVQIYKGDIPASSGGRLSSLLDIRMKEGNSKNYSATGGIGTISSRLTLEGPVITDRSSFIVSGRRTYADMFLPLSSDKGLRDNKLYFYDFNAKINHRINDNNRLFASGYFGRDVFKNNGFEMSNGNKTATLRWNHLFSKKLFSNFTMLYSKYDYKLGTASGTADAFEWISNLEDLSAKGDFSYYINPKNTLKFGASATYHTFDLGKAVGKGEESSITDYLIPKSYASEYAVYVGDEQTLFGCLTMKYGLRYSVFEDVGHATYYVYDKTNFKEYTVTDTIHQSGNGAYKTYGGLEPRLGLTLTLNEVSSVKASYSRTRQYIHLAQNSTSGTPLDLWYPSSPNVKPQLADQYAIGYFRNFKDNMFETSAEVYYKNMEHSIDFRDHADLLLNRAMEGELRVGNSWSYGVEFLVKKNEGKLNGWVSYTLSKSERKIKEINEGKIYPSSYDKPHNINIVLNYELSKRVYVSANWIYATGAPFTPPIARANIGGKIVPIYAERNSKRMPDYHRLDLSLTLKGKEKPNKKWHSDLNFSLYNAYGRKNAWAINFVQNEDNPNETYAEKIYLFSVIPSVTYNFHF